MPRLIDADALMERLTKKRAETGKARYTEGYNDALLVFRSMVHGAPSVEIAKEVFVEIERILDVKIMYIEGQLFHNTASNEEVAQKKAFEEVLDDLAELKKKYTEGET